MQEMYGKKKSYLTQIGRWSKKFDWVKRVEAYDVHIEEKIQKSLEDERVTAAKKHIRIANKFLGAVESKLKVLKNKEISASELKNMAEFAVKTERDALGITNELKIRSDVTIEDKMGAKIHEDFMGLVEKALSMREKQDQE